MQFCVFFIMLAHLNSIECEMKSIVIKFWWISLCQVFWLKDNVEINTKDGYYIVSNTGDLLISQTQLRDMGNYTCGAKNLAARRLSESASLIVYGKVPPPPHLIKTRKKKPAIDFWYFECSWIWNYAVVLHRIFWPLIDIPITLTKKYVWPIVDLSINICIKFCLYTCHVWFDLFEAPLPLDINVSPVLGSVEEMAG